MVSMPLGTRSDHSDVNESIDSKSWEQCHAMSCQKRSVLDRAIHVLSKTRELVIVPVGFRFFAGEGSGVGGMQNMVGF